MDPVTRLAVGSALNAFVSFLSLQVAVKQISRDRVQQWARLVSDNSSVSVHYYL